MARKVLRRNRRKICVGDLRELVRLQTRTMTEPVFGTTNFTEDFNGTGETWAKIVTTAGKTQFDGVGTDVSFTHEITIRYDAAVSSETWIRYKDRRFDIINGGVEDLEERQEYLVLKCVDNGSVDKDAARA